MDLSISHVPTISSFERTLSSTTGYKSEVVNGGRVDNKGIELSLRFEDKWGNFGWSSYLTYSLNRNKVVELLRNYEDPYTQRTYFFG